MKYRFKYETTPLDLWQLSMYYTYSSMVGLCNMIYTAAVILLTIKLWGEISLPIRILLFIASSIFIVFQPLAVYQRAKKQVGRMPGAMELSTDEQGIRIMTEHQQSDIKWQTLKGISHKPTMLIIMLEGKQGIILSNKVLGIEKEGFYNYIISRLPK